MTSWIKLTEQDHNSDLINSKVTSQRKFTEYKSIIGHIRLIATEMLYAAAFYTMRATRCTQPQNITGTEE